MAPEPISTAYLKNPFHQSVCLHVYPTIVTMQRLGKNVIAAMDTGSELLYYWWFIANQFVLTTSPLRLTTSNSQLNTCGYIPYVTSSLTTGWVCRLHLLLVLASAVILRPRPAGLMTTFYCLRFETPPPGGPGYRIYIPQEEGGRVIHPGTGFLSIASYDLEGYGGGIRPSLHKGSTSTRATMKHLLHASFSIRSVSYQGKLGD
jgi:hypothetical protein